MSTVLLEEHSVRDLLQPRRPWLARACTLSAACGRSVRTQHVPRHRRPRTPCWRLVRRSRAWLRERPREFTRSFVMRRVLSGRPHSRRRAAPIGAVSLSWCRPPASPRHCSGRPGRSVQPALRPPELDELPCERSNDHTPRADHWYMAVVQSSPRITGRHRPQHIVPHSVGLTP